MDHVVIYENEAYLLKDQLKSDLIKLYNNCIFKVTLAIENHLLIGVHVSIRVLNIKEGIDKYISVNDSKRYKDYYDLILSTIKNNLYKLFENYIIKED